jgi:hypothetical protein
MLGGQDTSLKSNITKGRAFYLDVKHLATISLTLPGIFFLSQQFCQISAIISMIMFLQINLQFHFEG